MNLENVCRLESRSESGFESHNQRKVIQESIFVGGGGRLYF